MLFIYFLQIVTRIMDEELDIANEILDYDDDLSDYGINC